MGISETEYKRRYSSIKDKMKKEGFDSLIVAGLGDDFNRGNIRYLTGWGRGGYCIFPLERPPVWFINPNQSKSPKLSRTIEALSLLDLRETGNPVEQAITELSSCDTGKNIGLIGMSCMPVQMYLAVKEKFGQRLIDMAEFLRPLREIKSPEEIEKIRAAAVVADKVYRRLREIVRPGLSEYAIYGEVKNVIYQEGCEYSFDLLDAAGSNMNMAYYPTADKLENGGTLFMEISPAYQGYYAQLPVTLPIGHYQPHVRQMVEAWAQADQSIRRILQPGTRVSDLYNVLIDTIQGRGFVSPLRPGHSLGLDILDFWSITESNQSVLKSGMVIAVHPCCMTRLFGDGVGMGYTYLITDTGAEKLSRIDLAGELLA